MSLPKSTTGSMRNFIRQRISPRLSNLYNELGFAHRKNLAQNLNRLDPSDHTSILDTLAQQGILKGRFRRQISSLNEVQEYMLSGRVTSKRMESLGMAELETNALFLESQTLLSRISQVLLAPPQGFLAGTPVTNDAGSAALNVAFSIAKYTAYGIGATMLLWYVGVPALTPGLGLAVATGISVLATKYSGRAPQSVVGRAATFIARKISPLVYAADGGYLGYLTFEANLRFTNILEMLGLEPNLGILVGALLLFNHLNRKHLRELSKAYGGKLDPGEKSYLKKMMSRAIHSNIAEFHYIATRMVLLGSATAYLLLNTLGALGSMGFVPLAVPLLGVGLTVGMRAKKKFNFGNETWTKLSDHLKVYSPVWGLTAGAVAALAIGAASLSWTVPIAYATLYGSFATLFISELHGSFHSINTNMGFIASLKASGRDLLGKEEIQKLTQEKSVLAQNPHTGVKEHTFGALFTALINSKPGLTILTMCDRILYQRGQNLQNHQRNVSFIRWVKDLQNNIFNMLRQNITPPQRPSQRYAQLIRNYEEFIRNLEQTADYMQMTLKNEIEQAVTNHSDWFDSVLAINEYIRAAHEQLDLRADSLRKTAQRLERQLNAATPAVSEDNFKQNLSEVINCYDPDLNPIILVARKAIAGDEKEVRKVENVASPNLFRAATVYKGWYTEDAVDTIPVENWISGTWTRVLNPEYDPLAPAGSFEASKFLCIPLELALTDIQRQHRENLSTSRFIAAVNNEPAEREGFANRTQPLTLTLNGERITVNHYYYVTAADQNVVPAVKEIIYREGRTEADLPPDYQLATRTTQENPNPGPIVFTLPPVDYYLMMDKNDVQTRSYHLLPAILERAKLDKFLHLILRQPLKAVDRFGSRGLSKLEVNDPYRGEKDIDPDAGIEVIDANLELSYPATGRCIPLKLDRAAAHIGRDESVEWTSIKAAEIERTNGETTGFSLIYGTKSHQHNVNQALADHVLNRTSSFDPPTAANTNIQVKRKRNGNYILRQNGQKITLKQTDLNLDPDLAAMPGELVEIVITKQDEHGNRNVAFVYHEQGDFKVSLPPRDWPDFDASLGLPPDGILLLNANPFTHNPQREGDSSWLKIHYADGSVGFARIPDGKRPMLFNKNLRVAGRKHPRYYEVSQDKKKKKILIHDVHIPRGDSLYIARGWDRDLEEGVKIESVELGNRKGMRGRVFTYDQNGNELSDSEVELGNYKVLDRLEHVQATIEIIPSDKNPNKLTVVERRMDTRGLPEDRSKYIYSLSDAAIRRIEEEVIDLRWIEDVRIDERHRVVVTYTPAGSASSRTLELEPDDFYDNEGKALLRNDQAKMRRLSDLYQSPFYTPETERFKPVIDEYNGNLRLIVHKVKRYQIDKPANLNIPEGATVKIHPSAEDAVAVLETGKKIPITSREPLDKVIPMIDYDLSQVSAGEIKSAIGPQVRFGERGNISADYPRDPYFYGLLVFALHETISKWGGDFGINRAKSVRAFRGIESGRTHTMDFKLLYNIFADILPTNTRYYKKLSNFAEEVWGPGVSEDTQLEMAYWLKGIKMWVVKEMVALMGAEKEWGRYKVQNTERYDYSEVLFNLSFLLSKIDLLSARLNPFSRQPALLKWGEISEIAAGKTWYKWPFAKAIELSSIPVYLGTFGHVLFFPVNLVQFIAAWTYRTLASSWNYVSHLKSLGYNFATGFFKNPAMELTFLGGYARAAFRQFLDRNQYGTFQTTVGGTGETVPKNFKRWVRVFGISTTLALGSTVALMTLGGLASWLLFPTGIAALFTSSGLLARTLNANRIRRPNTSGKKRTALAAAGVAGAAATALGGAAMIIAGAPALLNPLSIAIIANFGFGLYSLGLLLKARSEMKRVEREDKIKNNAFNNQRPIRPSHQRILESIKNDLRNNRFGHSLQTLEQNKTRLKQILIGYGIMDKKGRIIQGIEHPYRNASHEILDTYRELEMTICLQAINELKADPNNPPVQRALLRLLRETSEYSVIETADKMYRRLNLQRRQR